MLDAFKIKPYDLEPIFATWTDGPVFKGKPKKDLPVDEWLERIRAGCVQRNIPEEYWYKVAQHFMGPRAKARFDELKAVITKVHGGKYRWSWKKFKIAMRSMGWEIDTAATETVKVQGKRSGLWWMLGKKDDKGQDTSQAVAVSEPPTRPVPSRSSSLWSKKAGSDGEEAALPPVPSRSESSFWGTKKSSKEDADVPARPTRGRSGSEAFWPVTRNSKEETEETAQRPQAVQAKSDTVVLTARGTPKPPTPTRSNTADSDTVTTHTQVPVWLLNACTALDYITSEHPKAMSVVSAILITAGSLPAIPAIGAGAGGAILASGAAQAIGAIAVGLGQALSTSVKNQQESQAPAQSSGLSTVR